MKIANLNTKKINSKRLLLVDGNNLAHRCYHGSAQSSNPKQVATLIALNQILNFKNLCLNSIMIVFWDSDYSYRAEVFDFYKQYKLQGEKSQKYEIIEHIKNVINSLGIQNLEQYGYEGDDLIALYASVYSKTNKCIIFSNDEDLLQCVKTRVVHYNPLKNEASTKETVIEKFEINPKDMAIRKALIGKKNEIPGVPRIGKKTALKVIKGEVDFPDFDKELFKDYIEASSLPFQFYNDPLKLIEVEKFDQQKNKFKSVFENNDFNNFTTTKSMKVWSKAFGLKD